MLLKIYMAQPVVFVLDAIFMFLRLEIIIYMTMIHSVSEMRCYLHLNIDKQTKQLHMHTDTM